MRRLQLILCTALFLFAGIAQAHPWHTSFAEMDWNEAGDTLEIALRVLPEDLETALTWRSGEPVVLVDTPQVRTLALAYLADHFVVYSESGQSFRPAEILGMELAYDASWLFFTVPANASLRLSLHNSVLMDVGSNQTNRVQRLWTPADETLLFTTARPELPFWQGR
ncbi:DUF6702 family protein [Parahaliea aestuarii]|uniref:DUF1850 domain-containing protein n=1 Tax=Parahaliea aestuarii TaxID=1852021 RepID=A0A5C9A0L0_9GAMM|nr:DUF6702 family protein [Parahaliea aestuarii]TXS93137.1 hypothetical protein FVW59_04560 [Parahaliea aestuarii]